jgi:hypothetical protein
MRKIGEKSENPGNVGKKGFLDFLIFPQLHWQKELATRLPSSALVV